MARGCVVRRANQHWRCSIRPSYLPAVASLTSASASSRVRFHVDDMSSAHVYARLPQGMTYKAMPKGLTYSHSASRTAALRSHSLSRSLGRLLSHCPPVAELLADCAQLTKANSIEGNKKLTGRVKVVYTPASNLLKTGAMTTGQVGFKVNNLIAYTTVEARDNAIVNRLDKTRVEKDSDSIQAEREERDAAERRREKEEKKARVDEEKRVMAERKQEKEARSYDSVFDERNMTSNQEIRHATSANDEDFDFM